MGDVQVLVATMNRKKYDYTLLDNLNINSKAIIVNQCDRDEVIKFYYNGYDIIWIDSKERGISKSRNTAINYADADFCLLVDDDEILKSNYSEIINRIFLENNKVSLIRFRIEGIEKSFKKYPTKAQNIGFFKSMKISSVEVAFKRQDILDKNIKFDELLGAGSEFNHGEENVFVYNCLKNKLKVKYVPIVIAQLHIGTSSWFKGFNKHYLIGSGAAYAAMSKRFTWLFIMQFAIRHYNLYKENMSFFSATKYMFDGKKQYFSKLKELGRY